MRNHALRIGRYWLVLLAGCLAASSAGATIWSWSEQPPLVDQIIYSVDVAASETAAIAVGYGQGVWRTTDGKSWQPVATDPQGYFRFVTHIDGVFLAVGNDGIRFSVDDGLTWQAPTSAPQVSMYSAIRYAGSWYAFRGSWLGQLTALQSDDLLEWEFIDEGPMTMTYPTLATLATDGDVLVGSGWAPAPDVGGRGIYSTDGETPWQAMTPSNRGAGELIHDGEQFIGSGSGAGPPFLYLSADGMNWVESAFPDLEQSSFFDIAQGNGGYLVAGSREGQRDLLFSTDLEHWEPEFTMDSSVRALVAFRGGWIGVGSAVIRGEPASASAIPALSPMSLGLLVLLLAGAGLALIRFRA